MYQLQLSLLLRQVGKLCLLFCITSFFLLLSSSTFAQHPPHPYPDDKELSASQTEEVGEYWKNLSDDIEKKEGGEQAGPSQQKSAQEFEKAAKKYEAEGNPQKAQENRQKAADQYRRAGENMKNSDPAQAADAFKKASGLYEMLHNHCLNDRNKKDQAPQFKKQQEEMNKKAQEAKQKAEQKKKEREANANNADHSTPKNARARQSRGRGRNQANPPPKRKLVKIAILLGKGTVQSDAEDPELRSWSGPFLRQALKMAVGLKAANANQNPPINVEQRTEMLFEKVKNGEIVRVLVKTPRVDYLYSFYPRSTQFKQAFGENDIILFMGHAQGNHGTLLAGMNSKDAPLDVATLPNDFVEDKTIILFRCYSSNAAKALAGKGGKAWGTAGENTCVPLPTTRFTNYLSNILENISKGMSQKDAIADANKTLQELIDGMRDKNLAGSSGLMTPAHK